MTQRAHGAKHGSADLLRRGAYRRLRRAPRTRCKRKARCSAERSAAMIKYALKCLSGHEFESWFASAASFEDQAAQGRVTCPSLPHGRCCQSDHGPGADHCGRDERADPAHHAGIALVDEKQREVAAGIRAFRNHVLGVDRRCRRRAFRRKRARSPRARARIGRFADRRRSRKPGSFWRTAFAFCRCPFCPKISTDKAGTGLALHASFGASRPGAEFCEGPRILFMASSPSSATLRRPAPLPGVLGEAELDAVLNAAAR